MHQIAICAKDSYQLEIARHLDKFTDAETRLIIGIRDKKATAPYHLPSGKVAWPSTYIRSLCKIQELEKYPLDASISKDALDIMSLYEGYFLRICDRSCYYPLHTSDLIAIYTSLVSRWITAFRRSDISCLIFFSTPHLAPQFASYVAARVLDLQIRILNRTGIGLTSYISDSIDIEPKSRGRKRFLNNEAINNTIDPSEDWFKTYSQLKNNEVQRTRKRVIAPIINIITSGCFSAFKETFLGKGAPIHSSYEITGPRSSLAILRENLKLAFRTKELFKLVAAKSSSRLPSGSYLYFPLHFQPERTTLPEGGVFVDQIRAISYLRSLLPKNVRIVVKHHPRQFDLYDSRKGYLLNNYLSYEARKIIQLDGVELIHPDFDSEVLLKSSCCVATITGTTGWDAIKLGKPVILFGDSWYRDCKACLHVKDLTCESLEAHLAQTNESLQQSKIEFLEKASQWLVPFPNEDGILPASDGNSAQDTACSCVARCIYESLKDKGS